MMLSAEMRRETPNIILPSRYLAADDVDIGATIPGIAESELFLVSR